MIESSKYQVGERVDITIRGARVVEPSVGPDRWLGVAIGNTEADLPVHLPDVTVARVAPKEWPPQLGDIWSEANGREWFATDFDGETVIMRAAGSGRGLDALDVLADFGPLALVRRRGWTPPAAEPEAAPEQAARNDVATGLRALADLIDAHPELPTGFTVQYCMGDSVGLDGLAAWARALDANLRTGPARDGTQHHTLDTHLCGLDVYMFRIEPVDRVDPDAWAAQVAQDARTTGPEAAAQALLGVVGHQPDAERVTCAFPGDQEHDHEMCHDVLAEEAERAELGAESVEDAS